MTRTTLCYGVLLCALLLGGCREEEPAPVEQARDGAAAAIETITDVVRAIPSPSLQLLRLIEERTRAFLYWRGDYGLWEAPDPPEPAEPWEGILQGGKACG